MLSMGPGEFDNGLCFVGSPGTFVSRLSSMLLISTCSESHIGLPLKVSHVLDI